ncbi:hypothetical protein QYE76_023918 [Lolium multiflorum]|uniref:Uncharacterized protein n=1 Tax=Lolium multiflorum TaxID=4521 RepID=A0AAD8RD32_LOLMU|nr:hypothetical protein QYE76_023918 [Lolium multiflorum]
MKDRITRWRRTCTYALAAIVNKKSEIAADVERYALELHKATESLNFIALNRAEESKRVYERVNALIELSSAEEIFWREHSTSTWRNFRIEFTGLLSIANATGNLEELYPKVLLPANIIVDMLEEDSRVPEERGTPQG